MFLKQILPFILVAFIIKIQNSSTYTIFDLIPATSQVQEFKQGGGKSFESAQHSIGGEKGDQGHLSHHQINQGQKGHHDKENKKQEFAEEGGHQKGHQHNDGYYEKANAGSKGSKGYHYEDEGSYAKGHSTKGHHNIHKLDEYKKDKEFYDEDHDEDNEEKHGGYELKKNIARGKGGKGGHFRKVYFDQGYGLDGKFDKGHSLIDENGHNKAQGHNQHYANEAEFGKKGGSEGFKEYGFKLVNK